MLRAVVTSSTLFPDPLLAADLEGPKDLDPVIRGGVMPVQHTLDALETPAYLWLFRRTAGVPAVRLRIHAAAEHRERLREAFETAARALSSTVPEANLRWTSYARPESAPIFGGPPFLDDDVYMAHASAFLGHGCAFLLDELGDAEVWSRSLRQMLLLRQLIFGLDACDFPAAKRVDYLVYHRDWLVRFPLLRGDAEQDKADRYLAALERQAAGLESFVETLRGLAAAVWETSDAGADETRAVAGMRAAARALRDHLAPRRDDPAYRVDRFATDPLFAPLFKVFNGGSNPLGIGLGDKALAVHLLLRAAAPERAAARIRLRPEPG